MEPGGTDPARRAVLMHDWLLEFQAAISQMESCRKPVIAAIHNIAYGLAIDILSAVDIRYAEEDARFSIKEVDAGLAADIGTLQRFPKIVANDSWVRELCFTGREFDSKEALEHGFLSRVVKGGKKGVLNEAIQTAIIMAGKSPVALRNTKHLLLHSRDHSVQEGLEYTAAWNSAGLQSEEIPQAVGHESLSHSQIDAHLFQFPFLVDAGRHAKEEGRLCEIVDYSGPGTMRGGGEGAFELMLVHEAGLVIHVFLTDCPADG